MKKIKRNTLLIIVIIICAAVVYAARGFSLASTDAKESLAIFTQINLKNDFTDAKKIGIGSNDSQSKWKDNYEKLNQDYFKDEFQGKLSDEKIDELVKAELAMNARRKIQIDDVKVNGQSASATVSISKVNYSDILDKAIKEAKAAQPDGEKASAEKFSEALADKLIDGFNNAQPADDMTSFHVDMQRQLIYNNSDNSLFANTWLGKRIIVLLSGKCWYPKDVNTFFIELNKAMES